MRSIHIHQNFLLTISLSKYLFLLIAGKIFWSAHATVTDINPCVKAWLFYGIYSTTCLIKISVFVWRFNVLLFMKDKEWKKWNTLYSIYLTLYLVLAMYRMWKLTPLSGNPTDSLRNFVSVWPRVGQTYNLPSCTDDCINTQVK